MLRQRLLIACALCTAACAQIAGFEKLSPRKAEDAQGGSSAAAGSAAAGNATSAGTSSTGDANGGGVGGTEPATPTGGSDSGGGMGNTSSAGTAGSAASGGSLGSTGSAGSAGSASTTGGTGATAGAGGSSSTTVTGGCNGQLLENSDFDVGPLHWQQASVAPGILDVSDLIIQDTNPKLTAAGISPRSGHYLAWLGGVLDDQSGTKTILLQQVQIPAKVSKLVLSGWIQLKTTEPDASETADQLDLSLQDDENFWSFHVFRPGDVTTSWKSFSYERADADFLDALRGRTLTFTMEAIADSSFETSYWLDSLSLVATCPR